MYLNALTDKELILSYQGGDDKAFQELLTRHKNKIYTSIYLFVKDRSKADDIFQDVFIKIIDMFRRDKYNHEGKFVQWAMRIAYNMCVDNFRRGKRHSIVSPTDEFDIFDVIPQKSKNAEEQIMMSETHKMLRKHIDALPDEQKEVVILRHYAELSFKEISALTGVSINTALGRMRYALINLRKSVGERQAVA